MTWRTFLPGFTPWAGHMFWVLLTLLWALSLLCLFKVSEGQAVEGKDIRNNKEKVGSTREKNQKKQKKLRTTVEIGTYYCIVKSLVRVISTKDLFPTPLTATTNINYTNLYIIYYIHLPLSFISFIFIPSIDRESRRNANLQSPRNEGLRFRFAWRRVSGMETV